MAEVAGAELNATTLANPEMVEHAEMTALGLPPGGWVALSMIVVIAIIVWKKVPAAIAASLDRKIAGIRAQLDEAAKLRAEAEALKAEYEKKASAAAGEAASIVSHAHAEAALIVEKAKTDAETLIARRSRMAEDKIAAAERGAVAELAAKAAAAAAAAAAQIIGEKLDAGTDKALVELDGKPLIQHVLDRMQLLTAKPALYVCNVDEASAAAGNELSAKVAVMAARRSMSAPHTAGSPSISALVRAWSFDGPPSTR